MEEAKRERDGPAETERDIEGEERQREQAMMVEIF